MKKYVLFNVINTILLLVYVTVVVLQNQFKIVKISNSDFWFSVLIVIVGLSLIFKAVIFKSDSSTWFGFLLFTIGSVIYFSKLYSLSFAILWPTILSAIMFSSLIVAICFSDWFHLKISVWFFIVSVVCYLYSFKILSLFKFIVLIVISVVLAFSIAKLIPIKSVFNKKE